MSGVVAPLLHNKEPVNEPADNTEVPQFSTTAIIGAGIEEFNGAAVPLAEELTQPFTV